MAARFTPGTSWPMQIVMAWVAIYVASAIAYADQAAEWAPFTPVHGPL